VADPKPRSPHEIGGDDISRGKSEILLYSKVISGYNMPVSNGIEMKWCKEDRRQKAENKGQKAKDRGQMTENGAQKTESRKRRDWGI